MSVTTWLRRGAVVTAVAGTAVVSAAPAQAANAYRYWGYAQLQNGHWVKATTGAAQSTPADGSVEGWRFAADDNTRPRLPRAVLTFDTICGKTPAQDGKKRVGVVVDPGRTADAADTATTVPTPGARCVVVNAAATGAQVLAAAGTVREQKGMVCGIQGYPASGCGDAVPAAKLSAEAKAADTAVQIPVVGDQSAPAQQDTQNPNNSPGRIILGVGILAALVALAAMLFRRRSGTGNTRS